MSDECKMHFSQTFSPGEETFSVFQGCDEGIFLVNVLVGFSVFFPQQT